MIRVLSAIGLIAAMLMAGSAPSSAAQRQFCLSGNKANGGMPDCSFSSWEQCRMSIGGGNDSCFQNPWWRGVEKSPARPAPRRQARQRY